MHLAYVCIADFVDETPIAVVIHYAESCPSADEHLVVIYVLETINAVVFYPLSVIGVVCVNEFPVYIFQNAIFMRACHYASVRCRYYSINFALLIITVPF